MEKNKKPKRKLSGQFKARLVIEYIKGIKSQADICRENALSPNLFAKWYRQFQENVHQIFEGSRNNDQLKQIERLEKIIGKQTIEIDFLKEAHYKFNL